MRRRTVLAGATMVAALFAAASMAWACTNFTRVDAITPSADVPRSQVAVRGVAGAAGVVMELRWNALDGPVIGTATSEGTGGAFLIRGEVPAVAPGVYSVIAAPQGKEIGVGRIAFEVTAAPGTASAAPTAAATGPGADSGLWSGSTSGSAGLDSPSATDAAVQLGVIVFAVGLVGVAAGAAVLGTRRRRALAGARGNTSATR